MVDCNLYPREDLYPSEELYPCIKKAVAVGGGPSAWPIIPLFRPAAHYEFKSKGVKLLISSEYENKFLPKIETYSFYGEKKLNTNISFNFNMFSQIESEKFMNLNYSSEVIFSPKLNDILTEDEEILMAFLATLK